MKLPTNSAFLTACAFVYCLSAVPSFAEDDAVKQCLDAPYYPEAISIFQSCDVALKQQNLPAETLAKINLQMGLGLGYSQRPDLAKPYLQTAIKLDPNLAEAHIQLGIAEFYLQNYQQAFEAYGDALAVDPNNLKAQFELAYNKYLLDRDCNSAVSRFEKILAQKPDYYLVRYNLAGAYECVDRDENRNVAEFSKLIDLGRDKMSLVPLISRRGVYDFDFYTRLHNDRAEAYSQMGRYDLAIKDYDDGLIYFPNSAYLLSARGDVKLRSRINFSGALDDYNQALSLNPKYLLAKLGKLGALESLGKFDEVTSLASEMLDPLIPTGKEGTIYQARARSYKKLGKTKLAFHDYRSVFDIGSEFERNNIYNYIIQGGYLQKPFAWEKKEVPDFQSKVVINGLEACVVDPECPL